MASSSEGTPLDPTLLDTTQFIQPQCLPTGLILEWPS